MSIVFCSRAYQISTGQADMDTYVEIEKWGEDLDVLSEDLTPNGWWMVKIFLPSFLFSFTILYNAL